MAPTADPTFQQAMDKLLLQVNRDNVLAVRRAFQDHADELRIYLDSFSFDNRFGLCGDDPVSHDAVNAFGGKIAQLLDVHWKHWAELEAVVKNLHDVALRYGKSEDEITASLDQR